MSDNSPFPDRTVTAVGGGGDPVGVDQATQTGGYAPALDRTSFPTVPPDAGDSFGNYELVSEIARGGMGVVFRARQKGLDRLVALKMILGQADDALRQRLLLEAKAAAALDHPNVVPVYDSGEVNGQLYFTMAFIDGPDLKKYAESRGQIPLPEAMRLFGQIVAGVAHAHGKNVIHRDLKPANVLINRDGRPQVTDFGLAKRTDGDMEMTKTGQVMGTPAYMAPEQARGRKVGPAADVYALGGIMYYLLTGRPPFVGETVTDILVMLATEPPQPPRELIAELPPELETICLKCLEKDPEARYPDARALAVDLAPLLDRYLPSTLAEFGSTPSSGFGSSAGPSRPYGLQSTTFGQQAQKPAADEKKGNPWLVGGGVAAAVVALAAVAAVAMKGGNSSAVAVAPAGTGAAVQPAATGADVVKPGELVKPAEMVKPAGTPGETVPVSAKIPFPARLLRQDFGLSFELIAVGTEADGVKQFKDGDRLKFRVRTNADCHLRVWSVDADGTVVQLFPNKFDPDDRITADVQRDMPGSQGYTMTMRPSTGGKPDRLRVLASTTPISHVRPDQEVAGYNVYASAGRTRLCEEIIRGIEIAAANPAENKVADAELLYLVTK